MATGEHYYYDGKPCRHGHDAPRKVSNHGCAECALLYTRRPEVAARNRASARAWIANNPEKAKAKVLAWRAKFPDRAKEIIRKYQRANPAKLTHWVNARRARQANATPPWADLKAIENIYAGCPKGQDVDHIVPLKGEGVCGLHVPWNLQHLDRSENRKKSNKFETRCAS